MRHQAKPTIMILGSGHLANWGADSINYRMDDVLAPKRQTELQQLVEQLTRFKPTKVAVEVDTHKGGTRTSGTSEERRLRPRRAKSTTA